MGKIITLDNPQQRLEEIGFPEQYRELIVGKPTIKIDNLDEQKAIFTISGYANFPQVGIRDHANHSSTVELGNALAKLALYEKGLTMDTKARRYTSTLLTPHEVPINNNVYFEALLDGPHQSMAGENMWNYRMNIYRDAEKKRLLHSDIGWGHVWL